MFSFISCRPRESKAGIPKYIPWARKYLPPDDNVLTLGMSAAGCLEIDLKQHPHILVAGEGGSGGSVLLRSLALQMGVRGATLYFIDCKGGVEFDQSFEKYGKVVTDRARALTVLKEAGEENETRRAPRHEGETEKLPKVVIVIDELAELLDRYDAGEQENALIDELESILTALMHTSCGTGIHVFIGVQRPDVTLLSRELRDGLTARICGRFANRAPSEIVLGSTMAMDLPDVKGRFILRADGVLTEFQTYWFKDEGL